MDEENSESSSSRGSKKRKTRGPTLCKKLKEKMANRSFECTVDFSQYGVPTGKMRKKFNSYIGSVVRLHVNINIESWDVVNKGLKEMIWDDIKAHWNLKDDLPKKKIFRYRPYAVYVWYILIKEE
ncbi:hypothetical protein POM88_007253 [Heracleum sosnowskyi]|uniref:Uncharacterized protein n=1 Tax=Heracleum sosnowskyi TaxID=360622 RepID=A0AAD8J7S3_9APIA|nr:hypothetical protein POM88_007253 [Heracleum sosnowskyi]